MVGHDNAEYPFWNSILPAHPEKNTHHCLPPLPTQNLVDPLREQSATTAEDLYSDARFHLYLTSSILEQMIIHIR